MKPIKTHINKPQHPHTKKTTDDLFQRCLKKGLIQKTDYGYYFTPEFFETLEIYNE